MLNVSQDVKARMNKNWRIRHVRRVADAIVDGEA